MPICGLMEPACPCTSGAALKERGPSFTSEPYKRTNETEGTWFPTRVHLSSPPLAALARTPRVPKCLTSKRAASRRPLSSSISSSESGANFEANAIASRSPAPKADRSDDGTDVPETLISHSGGEEFQRLTCCGAPRFESSSATASGMCTLPKRWRRISTWPIRIR